MFFFQNDWYRFSKFAYLLGLFGSGSTYDWSGWAWVWTPDKFQSMSGDYDPVWSPRDNQRWTALFHSFDVFQRWFRGHEKNQRWSALFQRWSALIFSESALFSTEKFSAVSELNSAVSERNSSESALFSADFLSSETLGFQRWTALFQRWFTLI